MPELMSPMEAIQSDPPNVWLTSFYGFDPSTWGFLGFSSGSDRDRFVRLSEPGALVVVYGTKNLEPEEAGLILGVMQVTHEVGTASQFADLQVLASERGDQLYRWDHAVRCVRAWELPLEHRPTVNAFADATYSNTDAQVIGRYGKQMTEAEAAKLLDLPLIRTKVWAGEGATRDLPMGDKPDLSPSKPGPVSQTPSLLPEAEGPKHLYILRLMGKLKQFIGEPLENRWIVKVGFSFSPDTRKKAFNAVLPGDRIRWEVLRSTFRENAPAVPTSAHALAGEGVMKTVLNENGRSLGGEFFLADQGAIALAWREGLRVAGEHHG